MNKLVFFLGLCIGIIIGMLIMSLLTVNAFIMLINTIDNIELNVTMELNESLLVDYGMNYVEEYYLNNMSGVGE